MVIKNQKAKAVAKTAAFVAVIVGVSIILQLVAAYLDRDTIMKGLAGIVLLFLLYTIYGLFLAKIQYDDKIREMGKKFSVDQK